MTFAGLLEAMLLTLQLFAGITWIAAPSICATMKKTNPSWRLAALLWAAYWVFTFIFWGLT